MAGEKQGSALERYFRGAGYFGRGVSFALAHARLWPWLLAPSLVTAAITALGAWWAHRFAAAFVDAHSAGHWALTAALIRFFLWIFVALVGLVAFLAASLVASAPFAGPLSARVESLATGRQAPKERLGETVASIGHVLVAVTVYLVISALLFALQLLLSPLAPVLGALGFLVTAKFLAYDSLDFPLSRRGASFAEKWQWLARHRAESYGFGSVIALLAFVPGLGLIVPALAAVGATLLFLDLEGVL